MNNQGSDRFAARLRSVIDRSGIKQTVLAKAAGVTPQTLSRYLRGDRVPHGSIVKCLADRLQVSVSYLLGESPQAAPLADQPVANETHGVYTPDAVSLVGLNEEERRTILRMIEALRSGQLDVQQHLIGQLKIIELVVQSRRNQPHKKEGHGA